MRKPSNPRIVVPRAVIHQSVTVSLLPRERVIRWQRAFARRVKRLADAGVPVVLLAYDTTPNYLDTAPYYCKRESESVLGKAIKGWRDRVYVDSVGKRTVGIDFLYLRDWGY